MEKGSLALVHSNGHLTDHIQMWLLFNLFICLNELEIKSPTNLLYTLSVHLLTRSNLSMSGCDGHFPWKTLLLAIEPLLKTCLESLS